MPRILRGPPLDRGAVSQRETTKPGRPRRETRSLRWRRRWSAKLCVGLAPRHDAHVDAVALHLNSCGPVTLRESRFRFSLEYHFCRLTTPLPDVTHIIRHRETSLQFPHFVLRFPSTSDRHPRPRIRRRLYSPSPRWSFSTFTTFAIKVLTRYIDPPIANTRRVAAASRNCDVFLPRRAVTALAGLSVALLANASICGSSKFVPKRTQPVYLETSGSIVRWVGSLFADFPANRCYCGPRLLLAFRQPDLDSIGSQQVLRINVGRRAPSGLSPF